MHLFKLVLMSSFFFVEILIKVSLQNILVQVVKYEIIWGKYVYQIIIVYLLYFIFVCFIILSKNILKVRIVFLIIVTLFSYSNSVYINLNTLLIHIIEWI